MPLCGAASGQVVDKYPFGSQPRSGGDAVFGELTVVVEVEHRNAAGECGEVAIRRRWQRHHRLSLHITAVVVVCSSASRLLIASRNSALRMWLAYARKASTRHH